MKLTIGNRYNWKNQPERLIYMGCKMYPGNGGWHQFAKGESPSIVWCEVRTADLEMFEETEMTTKQDAERLAQWLQFDVQPGVMQERCLAFVEATAKPVEDKNIQRVINRLESSDLEFDDCSEAAALLRKLAAENEALKADAAQAEAAVIKRLAAGVSVEPVNNDLADDISAIDCMYRGDPSYEHDAYYMREQATKRVRNGYQLFTLDQLNTAIAAARAQMNERCVQACADKSKEYLARSNRDQHSHGAGLGAAICVELLRALLGKEQS